MVYGPKTRVAREVHSSKYRGKNESFKECCNRISSALTESENEYYGLRDILLNQRFLPGGRIQSTVGSPRASTAFNCFVSAEIEDSMDGIMKRASEGAATMRLGGGIGFNFSTIRPKDAMIQTLDSGSSGAVSFMQIYDAVCSTVKCAGNRRGAMMGVLRIDHPDIEEFIEAKQNEDNLRNFNLSVAVTDKFMEAVRDNGTFELKFDGKVYKTVRARNLWEKVMRSTWYWSEPGVLFVDTANRMNNLWYCEELTTTNPCAEQWLPAYGACLLGSFNLTKYSIELGGGNYGIDYDQLRRDIPKVVRAMDNVIDNTEYPLPQQKEEALAKRRMGIGYTGMANAIERLGHLYGSQEYLIVAEELHKFLRGECYKASIELAKERGSFPAFEAKSYTVSDFFLGLPPDIRQKIHKYGIRNSHLISYAPTGTISLTADNVSSGIEPVFSWEYDRSIINEMGEPEIEKVLDYGYNFWGVKGRKAQDIKPEEHLEVLALATKYCDSAVSKTINIGDSVTWDNFKYIYFRAWEMGCKGVTTYRPSGKRKGVLVDNGKEGNEGACYIDPITGDKSCS